MESLTFKGVATNPVKKRRREKAKAKDNRIMRGGGYPYLKRLLRGEYTLTKKGEEALKSCLLQ